MTLEQAGKLDFDDAAISEAMRWTGHIRPSHADRVIAVMSQARKAIVLLAELDAERAAHRATLAALEELLYVTDRAGLRPCGYVRSLAHEAIAQARGSQVKP